MTQRVFWEEPYRRDLQTRIATVQGDQVTLEETIFFAFSGGQESDRGTIAGLPVLEARLDGAEIRYRLAETHGLTAGQKVMVEIDWARRYRLMRLHFAAELVLELVTRRFPGIARIGAHIAEDKARIDFILGESIAPYLPDLDREVREIIEADLPIESAFGDRAAGRRYWKIDGFAAVPCGGTHLRRSGEVGRLTLKRRNPGKGKERIEITLAEER